MLCRESILGTRTPGTPTMPLSERNRLVTWYLLVKDEWLPTQRRRLEEWWSAVRAEPRLAWETPQVRYGVFGLGIVAAVLVVASLFNALTLPPPAAARPEATTANFHVVCSNPTCGHHFLIVGKFGFDDFPVNCPRCNQKTGQRALRCKSSVCQGRYVPTVEKDGQLHCRICDAPLGPAP